MYYIVLDMEWNQAFDPAHVVEKPVRLRGEIIQLGAVKCDESFNYVDKLKINIAPKYYKKMNRHVEKITGITSDMLAGGAKFPDAFRQFKEWCSPEFRIITWGFDDIAMLADNLELHGLDPSFGRDYVNLQLIYKNQVDNERVQWSLEDAVERLGIPANAKAHDAMNDAWFTFKVCQKLDMQKGLAEYSSMSAGQRQLLSRTVFRDYKDIRKITSDTNLVSIECPECGKELSAGEWLSFGNVRRSNICSCPEHGEYLVKLVCKKSTNECWIVTRSVYKSDDEAKQSYQKKIEKQRAAAAKRHSARGVEIQNADDSSV